MEWLVEVFLRLFLIIFFGVGTWSVIEPVGLPDGQGGGSSNTVKSFTHITDVEVIVMESYPMQVQLRIRGEHPDGCDLPVHVAQQRAGNIVVVEVYRDLPIDILCPMLLVVYEDTVMLADGFEPGEYTFIVNEYSVTREL